MPKVEIAVCLIPLHRAVFLRTWQRAFGRVCLFFVAGCWKWGPLSAIALFFLTLGVSAMYGGQYLVAAAFYFVGVSLLTARFTAEAKSHASKGGAVFVIVFVGALVFAGSLWLIKHTYETQGHGNVFSTTISGAGLITWGYASKVWELPWRWIVTGFIFGFVLATFSHVTRTRRLLKALVLCPDEQAHRILKGDEAAIDAKVRINYIAYDPDFQKSHIDFHFHIFNISLYDIVIDNKLGQGSFITYDFGECNHPRFQYPPIIESNKVIYCSSRRPCGFTVRQPIRQEGLEPN